MVQRAERQGLSIPLRTPGSNYTQERLFPTKGYTDLPDVQAGPASVISGQNMWLWQNRLTPRPCLISTTNPLSDTPVGAMQYQDVTGVQTPIIFSRNTAAYYAGGGWTALTYAPSPTSNNPPTAGAQDKIRGTFIYLPRADVNIAVWTNGVDPAFVWKGQVSGDTTYSTMTQGFIAKDVTVANNRLVYWNVGYLSSTSQWVTTAVWSAAGNPEDTSGPDSGYQQLADMQGVGTRCFPIGDQLVVATDKEIWRSQYLGPPFAYQFVPLSRAQGIPFPSAAIQVPEGVYWLGADMMVYNIPSFYWYSKIDPVGQLIQRTLHLNCPDPSTAFFNYHSDAKMLSLYYSDTAGQYPNRALTLNTLTGQWMPQLFQQRLAVGYRAAPTSSATTWGGLTGPLTGNVLNYNQLLGQPGPTDFREAVASSTGTTYVFDGGTVRSAFSDDGVPMYAEAHLGPFFTGSPDRRKFTDEIRADVQCDTANTALTMRVLSHSSSALSSGGSFTLSQGSQSSQYRLKVNGVTDIYHNVLISSVSGAVGSWSVNAISLKGVDTGEAI